MHRPPGAARSASPVRTADDTTPSGVGRRCTAAELRACLLAATAWLERQADTLNALNVFPVPDGDTGTNMALTMQAAVRDLQDEGAMPASTAEVAARVEYGALMGARGNSGVILSQILRGFARGLHGRRDFDALELAAAFQQAAAMAYKAVIKPVEGTMLTVAREAAEAALVAARTRNDLVYVLGETLTAARASVRRTPELLDRLREAGVVDAGGQGVAVLIEGAYFFAIGETPTADPAAADVTLPDLTAVHEHHPDDYGYCTNFMITGEAMPYEAIRAHLADIGHSAVIVGHERLIKVHLHTLHPGEALEYALQFGALSQIKIDNMDHQRAEFERQQATPPAEPAPDAEPAAPIAVLAVSSGEGFSRIFTSLGAGGIITGGQTMNPSAEAILKAVQAVPQREMIILPNNENIVLAARQAAELSDKQVEVVATRTLPQGLAALLAFSPEASLADNVAAMRAASEGVMTGEITRASRSVELQGVQVHEGEIMALLDDQIVTSTADADAALLALLKAMAADQAELITLYYGQSIDPAMLEHVTDLVAQHFPDATLELLDGGQPHYDFIVSVE